MTSLRWRRQTLVILVASSPLLLVLAAAEERGRTRQRPAPGPEPRVQGRVERCLACHAAEASALSPAHAAEALGCSSCHLGNPLALHADRAHVGLERFPGDLSTAAQTCGRSGCHPQAVERVRVGLMADPRGLLAVNRFAFGERPTPDGVESFPNEERWPTPHSPATSHARKLCASCHLGTRHQTKQRRARGGGCAACHLRPGRQSGAHPQLRLGTGSEACVGCHSRSGRVALSYWGWHEGRGSAEHPVRSGGDEGGVPSTRRLPDGREVSLARSDLHAAAGMGCVDCHTTVGLMGDGRRWRHKEEQVDVSCEDCHGDGGPRRPSTLDAKETEALRIERLLHGPRARVAGTPVARTRRGTPLPGLWQASLGTWALRRRMDGQLLKVRPVPRDAAHHLPGHERLRCQACHTGWSHQCTGCHTRHDPKGSQWDNVVGARTAGRWVETGGDTRIDRPTLGVDPHGRIGPFLPGMPIAVTVGTRRVQRRLYAPADPHTTTRRARPCASCHADPLALGLGRGRLWQVEGTWHFEPAPAPAASSLLPTWPDGVPWDGWTALVDPGLAEATRVGARPLLPEEMNRILTVSTCLPCHGSYQDPLYQDFRRGLARLRSGVAPRCAGPRTP